MPLSKITNPFLDSAGSARSNVYSPSANTIAITTATAERLRVDSSGNVGIGTGSPADKLHVALSSSSLGGIRVQNTNASGQAAVSYYNNSGSQKADVWWNNSDSTLYLRTLSTDPMVFSTNNTERIRIDSSGRVISPYQPAFSVQRSTGVTAPAVIAYDQVVLNVGSNYSTSTGRFTAPVAGNYFFYCTFTCDRTTTTGDYYCDIRKNGTAFLRVYTNGHSDASAHPTAPGEIVLPMAANDYVDIYFASGATGIHANSIHNVFGGHMIG